MKMKRNNMKIYTKNGRQSKGKKTKLQAYNKIEMKC
jgi:hypothetical protein